MIENRPGIDLGMTAVTLSTPEKAEYGKDVDVLVSLTVTMIDPNKTTSLISAEIPLVNGLRKVVFELKILELLKSLGQP